MAATTPDVMQSAAAVITPVMQWGFAGFAMVMVGINVWLIKRLLGLLDANNKIIAENTRARWEVAKLINAALRILRGVNERLLSRPCKLGVPMNELDEDDG